jgi:hypothetical protein
MMMQMVFHLIIFEHMTTPAQTMKIILKSSEKPQNRASGPLLDVQEHNLQQKTRILIPARWQLNELHKAIPISTKFNLSYQENNTA